MKKHKKVKIVHKDGATHIYDDAGNDLTETLCITYASVEFDPSERIPYVQLVVFPSELEIETDDANVEIQTERKDCWQTYVDLKKKEYGF